MKLKKKILIISDRFKNSGNGNYLRSNNLYKFLKKYLICKFLLFNKSKNISIDQHDLILLDLPYKNYNLNYLRKYKGIIVSLDHHLKFDVHLNISLFNKSNYAQKNLCSLKYAIIREDVKRDKNKLIKNSIFIGIGSSDIKNLRFKVYEKVKYIFDEIYISKTFNHKNRFSRFENKNFIKNMKSCDLAITNGGTTMLELIYLNKMIIALPQTELEKKFIKHVKKSYKIYSGIHWLKNNKIKKIIKQKQKKGLIDGNGCSNIMIEIKNLLKNAK